MNVRNRRWLSIQRLQCIAALGIVGSLPITLQITTAIGHDIVPGPTQTKPIAIQNVQIHPVSSPVIANGTITFSKGRIDYVGPATGIALPTEAIVIDGKGERVYPGLIDSDTALGLVEIEAIRATVDTRETGNLNPNVQAVAAFNPDSELIPVARSEGVLLAMSTPRGSFVAGQSALMHLDGWNALDMAMVESVGLHVQWPPASFSRAWNMEPDEERRFKARDRLIEQFTEALRDARAYVRQRGLAEASEANLRLEALGRVVRKELRVFFHADGLREIQECVAFAKEQDLDAVLVGGYDAPRCAELLRTADIPVIVTGTMRLPMRRNSPVEEPFAVPARLHEFKVRFCLAGQDRFSASAVRNLPQHAGMAVAYGLPPDDAVRAITLSAAEILGVAKRCGSLEVGKDATLVVTDGDILEIPTQVLRAFIEGREVDLDNRHKRLYRKYRVKRERAGSGPEDRRQDSP